MVTVTFVYGNGTSDKDVTVMKGNLVEEPVNPEKEGYRFEGWYQGEGEFYFWNAVNEDITLTAHYAQLYTVTYLTDGGTPAIDPFCGCENDYFRVSSTETVKEGYGFQGWLSSHDDQIYQAGNAFYLPAEDFSLTAQWIVLPKAEAPTMERRYGMNHFSIIEGGGNYHYCDVVTHYTTDGSTPTRDDPQGYTVTVSSDCTIKARTFGSDCAPSDVTSFSAVAMPGYVYYDCDADNAASTNDGLESATCGWRYLLAAADDVTTPMTFGYHRHSADGDNLFANGQDWSGSSSTKHDIGEGYRNTQILSGVLGAGGYAEGENSGWTANTAVRAALDYTAGGYDDWFLPSTHEMNLMQKNLYNRGGDYGNLVYGEHYWTSVETSVHAANCLTPKLAHWESATMGGGSIERNYAYGRIRPVMRFSE